MEKKSELIHDNQMHNFRNQIERLADELCLAVKGEFNFSITANSTDETVQKLAMLINFVIDAARRSLVSLKEQNAKLTELDKFKSDFLANISHELRTPLTLILGPLQSILEKSSSVSKNDKENLLRMQRNAAKLYVLVNDLLDFSKIEAGKLVLHEELIDLNQLVLQLIDDSKGLADEQKLTLRFSGIDNLKSLFFDRKAIEKIVMNLIGNALKFTPAGGHINVTLEKQKKTIILKVSDTGIGIPAEKINNLFNRFYQVDSSSTRHHQGTGIGLSLVAELVNLMNGKIAVKSQEGKGTEFIITLPVRTLPKKENTEKETLQKKSITIPFARILDKTPASDAILFLKSENQLPRILIADDNEDMRSYLISLLKDLYEIVVVPNGKLALEAIYDYQPQVILSDVMMPLLDGYQLTKKIKSDPKIQHIPIILITARAGKEELVGALEIGADDYLAKPFSPEELKARTNTALKGYESYIKITDLNHDLMKEIEERKKLEHKNSKLHSQLVVAARSAGMTDVATSVLHNVGNVLNSINTSVSMMDKKISNSKISNLSKLSKLLSENQKNLEFMKDSSKGQYVIDYLSELSEIWAQDKNELLGEVNLLTKSIQHIKDIIVKQNSLSTIRGVNEEVTISEIVEDALTLNQPFYEKTSVKIIRNFSPIKKVVTDRVKLLQILINLIKNGVEALLASKIKTKQLNIFITEEKDDHCSIKICDNGIGILPENLKKIFSMGFTMKKSGHGFGLHSSALSVQEIGGSLSVESEGEGNGATFTLLLPYQPPIKHREKIDGGAN